MKTIFLDIDGVLNNETTKDRIGNFVGLNPGHIKRFNKIIEAHPDTEIVISSTWRHSFTHGVYESFEELVHLLMSRGVKGQFVGHTPFPETGIYLSRGDEIRLYLNSHPKIKHFIVIDDDSSGMKPRMAPKFIQSLNNYEYVPIEIDLRPHWIQTSWESGLKLSGVSKAIKLLRGI